MSTAAIDLASFSSGSSGFIIQGAFAGDELGSSVNDAGDINGDGYGDILIGTDYSTYYVIYGKKAAFSTLDLSSAEDGWGIKIQANNKINKYGLSALGDVNNDHYNDIIIGTTNTINTAEDGAYIIFGQEKLSATIKLPDEANIPFLKGAGKLIGGRGDINNDSYSDVILANDLKNDGAYIVYGLDICNDYKYQIGNQTDNFFIGNYCPFIYDGKGGINRISYPYSTDWVLVDLNTGEGSHGDALNDKYTNIQNVMGSPYDDILRGNELDNKLYGMDGNDILEDIGGGNDEFTGNGGDDQFVISRETGTVIITDFQKGDKVNLINFPEIAQFTDVLKIIDSGEDSTLNLLPEKKVILKGISKDDLLESNFLLAVNPNLKAVEFPDKLFWNDGGGRELTWAIISPIITTAILGLLGWSWKKVDSAVIILSR